MSSYRSPFGRDVSGDEPSDKAPFGRDVSGDLNAIPPNKIVEDDTPPIFDGPPVPQDAPAYHRMTDEEFKGGEAELESGLTSDQEIRSWAADAVSRIYAGRGNFAPGVFLKAAITIENYIRSGHRVD
jgi:hypothetical protein